MNKEQALHAFWSSFGWDALDEQSAYDEVVMRDIGNPDRYITYEVATGNFGDPVTLTASLWHRSTSFEAVTLKANEIAEYIGYGGCTIAVDGGYLWIKLSTPFSRRMPDENNQDMRRLYLTISVDFLSAT